MEEYKKDRIGSCVRGENPTMIVKMKSGFAVLADNQFLPGYCIFLRYPKVASLSDLSLEERKQYLIDTTLIGDALNLVCKPRKINYSTLMNLDDYLHTHIEARYDWEAEEYKYKPICAIIFPHWHGAADAFLESGKIFRLSLLFSSVPTTALASKNIAAVPVTRGLLFPFLFLIPFNCAFGHSSPFNLPCLFRKDLIY